MFYLFAQYILNNVFVADTKMFYRPKAPIQKLIKSFWTLEKALKFLLWVCRYKILLLSRILCLIRFSALRNGMIGSRRPSFRVDDEKLKSLDVQELVALVKRYMAEHDSVRKENKELQVLSNVIKKASHKFLKRSMLNFLKVTTSPYTCYKFIELIILRLII